MSFPTPITGELYLADSLFSDIVIQRLIFKRVKLYFFYCTSPRLKLEGF